MQRRNLLKAACAAVLAPLYAVVGNGKSIDKWTASYAEPVEPCCVCGKLVHPNDFNWCEVCDGRFCSDHGGLIHGSRENIEGREVLIVGAIGKSFFVCSGCQVPNGPAPWPLPWERYFAKHNIKWEGDASEYMVGHNDPDVEETFACVEKDTDDSWGKYPFEFMVARRHRVTGAQATVTIGFYYKSDNVAQLASMRFCPEAYFCCWSRGQMARSAEVIPTI